MTRDDKVGCQKQQPECTVVHVQQVIQPGKLLYLSSPPEQRAGPASEPLPGHTDVTAKHKHLQAAGLLHIDVIPSIRSHIVKEAHQYCL